MGCSSSKYVDPDAILTSNFGHYATEPPAGEKGAYILPGVVHGGLRERFAARPLRLGAADAVGLRVGELAQHQRRRLAPTARREGGPQVWGKLLLLVLSTPYELLLFDLLPEEASGSPIESSADFLPELVRNSEQLLLLSSILQQTACDAPSARRGLKTGMLHVVEPIWPAVHRLFSLQKRRRQSEPLQKAERETLDLRP
jgi:hypothetical protein